MKCRASSITLTVGRSRFPSTATETEPIAFDADAAQVEEALEALEAITDVDVTGAGTESDPWVIEFVDPGAQDVPQIVANDDVLNWWRSVNELSPPH